MSTSRINIYVVGRGHAGKSSFLNALYKHMTQKSVGPFPVMTETARGTIHLRIVGLDITRTRQQINLCDTAGLQFTPTSCARDYEILEKIAQGLPANQDLLADGINTVAPVVENAPSIFLMVVRADMLHFEKVSGHRVLKAEDQTYIINLKKHISTIMKHQEPALIVTCCDKVNDTNLIQSALSSIFYANRVFLFGQKENPKTKEVSLDPKYTPNLDTLIQLFTLVVPAIVAKPTKAVEPTTPSHPSNPPPRPEQPTETTQTTEGPQHPPPPPTYIQQPPQPPPNPQPSPYPPGTLVDQWGNLVYQQPRPMPPYQPNPQPPPGMYGQPYYGPPQPQPGARIIINGPPPGVIRTYNPPPQPGGPMYYTNPGGPYQPPPQPMGYMPGPPPGPGGPYSQPPGGSIIYNNNNGGPYSQPSQPQMYSRPPPPPGSGPYQQPPPPPGFTNMPPPPNTCAYPPPPPNY
ncbi:hypothetical protein Pelo_5861 [Pelomyxa schiedti]|nr:hypothetical protein Pelo_5861 [Pelomyxa schiedti]